MERYTNTKTPREPIMLNLLHRLMDSLQFVIRDGYLRVMYRAMFTVAFHGLLQVGEMTYSAHTNKAYILTDKLRFMYDLDVITLPIYNAKTAKNGQVQKAIVDKLGGDYCPYKALLNFMALKRSTARYLFTDGNGNQLSDHTFRRTLTRCLDFCQIKDVNFNTHSMRSAGAMFLSQARLPDSQIQAPGRWTSRNYLKYIRQTKVPMDPKLL